MDILSFHQVYFEHVIEGFVKIWVFFVCVISGQKLHWNKLTLSMICKFFPLIITPYDIYFQETSMMQTYDIDFKYHVMMRSLWQILNRIISVIIFASNKLLITSQDLSSMQYWSEKSILAKQIHNSILVSQLILPDTL